MKEGPSFKLPGTMLGNLARNAKSSAKASNEIAARDMPHYTLSRSSRQSRFR